MIRSFNLIARLRAVPAAALLAALATAGPAQAAIPFFGTQFDASAVAEADGSAPEADWQMDGDTVSAQAASVGDVHAATAGAFAGPGFLTVSADVSAGASAGAPSHAVATAHFSGSFLSTGTVSLSLDYQPLTFTEGSGSAATTLFISLSNGGTTLFEDYVQGPWSFSYTPVAGSTSVLDLTLSSEVSAAFLSPGTGNASAFGSVAIMGAVPEASTWLMFSLGLAGVAALGRRRSRAAEVQA